MITLLTPTAAYEEDWQTPCSHYLRLLGAETACVCWTEPRDISGHGVVLPLLVWGYQRATSTWYALLDRLEQAGSTVINPVALLRWNSDKSYLFDLERAGVPIIPSRLVQALDAAALAAARATWGCDRLVVKPLVSGGADGTFLLSGADPVPPAWAGRAMLVQPFLPAIAEEGEYSLFYFDGAYSHAIVKRPAAGDFRVQEQFGGREAAIVADAEQQALALAALAAAPTLPSYARVDMLRHEAGHLCIIELGLIEPSLFLPFAPDGGAAFARAILRAAQAPAA